jgi:spheroidene monooxygenase
MRDEVIVLTLVDLSPNTAARAWGYARFLTGRLALRGTAGLQFVKVLGSGHEGGFGLKPSASRIGLFCVFDSDDAADAFIHHSAVSRDYARHAREHVVAKLRAYSSKGTWSGHVFTTSADAPESPMEGPVASLTRASIRPHKASAFWAMQPAAEAALQHTPGCLFSVGVGEAPVLRQATFSMWTNTAAMDAYARSGAHLAAIQAAYGGSFFSESAFVRFVPAFLRGQWKGQAFSHVAQPQLATV